jgi:hypothetical protein
MLRMVLMAVKFSAPRFDWGCGWSGKMPGSFGPENARGKAKPNRACRTRRNSQQRPRAAAPFDLLLIVGLLINSPVILLSLTRATCSALFWCPLVCKPDWRPRFMCRYSRSLKRVSCRPSCRITGWAPKHRRRVYMHPWGHLFAICALRFLIFPRGELEHGMTVVLFRQLW